MIEPLRYLADFLHLAAIFLLILRIYTYKSCRGLSYRTQEIYLVVFLSRYGFSLFNKIGHHNIYTLIMKVAFILGTAFTIYLVKFKRPHSLTFEWMHDKLPHYFTIYPLAAILTIIFHVTISQNIFKIYCWSFSVILEAFAMLPQLYMLREVSDLEVFSSKYVLCLGLYRLLYIFTWIQRSLFEFEFNRNYLYFEMGFGILQTAFLGDFCLRLIRHSKEKKVITIPI